MIVVEFVTGLLLAAGVVLPLPVAWLLTALTARAVRGRPHPRAIYVVVAVGSLVGLSGVGVAATASEGLGGVGEVLVGGLMLLVGGVLALAAAAGGYLRTRPNPQSGQDQ
jgi:hypothetical protein